MEAVEFYLGAINVLDRAREALECARGAIARIPDAPNGYWQGLGDESPLAEAWYRANRAVDELEQAQRSVRRAMRADCAKEEACERS